MANNSNHIMSRYGKWITNKQKERLRKLYKGYRQSTAGDMRSQYLNAHKGMYGVRTTASAYGLGEGYVARKKAQMDSSLAEAGRQYAAQADAAFENNAVRPAANATIQAENERKQREYEEKLRKAREKAAKQAKAQADYEKALEEYNRNKDKTDKENAKRLAEYKKAMAKYRKDLKNAKQRGERLDRLPQRQVLHGGQPLPKGLSLSADLHQYEGASSTPKPLKPLPKGKGKGKGKGNGRGGLLSDQMYEYESGTGHTPIATTHQGLNNRPVAPKTNYSATQEGIKRQKKAKEAVVGKPTKPKLAIDNTPIPVPPHIEKDLVAKAEAMKPEEIPQLKNDYINSAVEHENLVGDLYNALKPDMNRVGLAQEFNHWVGVAQNTALSPAERKQAAMYASRAAEEYNLQDNGKAHKERVATLMQMVNDSHEQLIQQQFLLQQKGVRMSEDEIGFDTGYLRQYGAIPAQASDATYAQAQALGDKNSDLGKQLRELTKMEYLHSQGLPSGQLSPQMQAFIEENNLGWLIDQEVLDRAPLVGIETAIEEKLKKGGDERTEYLQRKGIDRVQRELSTSDPEAIKRIVGDGDSVTHLKDALERGGDAFDKGITTMMERVESYIQNNLGVPSDYINKNTINALRKDEASVAFIDYCYATGQADLAKQFLFDLTEAANKAAGEKQADIISNLLPDGWKWIPEFMYHLGYGASNAIWGKIDFFRGKTPTRKGAYTQEGIIQNEIERWTDKLGKTRAENKARTWANALTSAGENFTDLAIGTLTKGALGAAGDAIGGTFGNIVGKVAGHAPGISMGWSAAGSAKQEMLKKGYNEKAATLYGIFSGVSEAVLQEQVGGLVGFGDRGAFTKALSGLVNQIPNAAGRTAINAVLDVASEIGQEEFGNILDSVYKSVALGEGNDVYADFKEQFNETAVTTAISTLLLNALHIPTQIRNERGYSAIADASGMSLNDAKFLLETDAAIKRGDRVDPDDILRYNELTASLMASMPDNVVKSINDGKMTVADWVTSKEGVVQGKLTGKLTEADTTTEAAKNPVTGAEIKAEDHTEALKGKTDEQKRDYLIAAAPTGKVGNAYYTTTNGRAIEFKNLNTTQKANYVLAQKCAKAFEGSVDVVIHDTLPLSNGAMVGSDGKLHIALDVTDNKGRESIAYWTLAHEAGHALKIADGKVWNEMFDVLTDYAKNYKDRDGKNLYDALVDSVTNQYKYDSNSDAFNDEMFSLIAERMVGTEGEQWAATLGDNTIFDAIAKDKNASAKAKRGFLGKLKSSVEKLSRQFRDGGFSKERKRLAKIREQLTEAYKRINEGESVREKYAEQAAQRRKETPAITRKVEVREGENLVAEKGIEGKTGTVRYGAGNKQTLKFHYAAVNVNDLVTSHTFDGSINDAYPAELQPRDRSRASSQQQILDIGNDIIPEKLGAYPGVQEGAPIIGQDMVVESGNGRTIALRYAAKNGKLKGYTAWLKEHASEYGFKAENIKPNTVLVRVRDSEVNRADFAKEANKTTIATMNATERAQTDADALESILNKYRFTEGADFNSSANSDFFSAFVDKVAGVNEANALLTSKGTLSNEGVTRIQNALFELAYHDKTLTEQFTEGDENPLRNIIKAMLNVAPVVAKTTADIAKGDFYDVNFASDFVTAERFLKDLKTNPDMDGLRKAEAYYEAYPSNLVEENPEYLKKLEIAIDNNLRSQRSLSYLLNRIIEGVQRLGSPNQLDMFGGMVDTSTAKAVNELKEQIVDRAVDALEQQKEEWANSTRFQMKAPVEESGDLVAVHNLSEDQLLKSFERGGFPMPSIAVLKAKSGHSRYGDISVVFGKDTIDPQLSYANKVYGGDAWTPTYPTIEYKPRESVHKRIRDTYYELSRKYGYDATRPLYDYVTDIERKLNNAGSEKALLENLYSDVDLMQLYAQISGKQRVEDVYKETKHEMSDDEKRFSQSLIEKLGENLVREYAIPRNEDNSFAASPITYRKEFINRHRAEIEGAYRDLLKQDFSFSDDEADNVLSNSSDRDLNRIMKQALHLLTDNGVSVERTFDIEATNKAIRSNVDEEGFREWIYDLFHGIIEKSGIRNNQDYFTRLGNRRSFEALHFEDTLENVVRVMKEQTPTGQTALFGGNAIWGVAAKSYKSVSEIKADESRLETRPEEEYSIIKKEFGDRFSEIANRIVDRRESNLFIALDNAFENLVDSLRHSKTKEGMLQYVKEYNPRATMRDITDFVQLVNDISNMPTEYFEAKPQRAVGIDEIKALILPSGKYGEVRQKATENDIPVIDYESGNEESRIDALNSEQVAPFRFQNRATDAEYLTLAEKYRDGTATEDEKAELEKRVEKAARKAGYTTGAYHGSPFTAITRFDTDKNTSKKQAKQLLFGTHFSQNKQYAEIYANKAKNSAGTGRMTYSNKGRVYDVLLNLGKALDLRTAKNYTPDTEMYQLYADMPDRIKRIVKAHTFSKYDTEQGLGSGNYVTASIVERCLQEMAPHDALFFLKEHGYNSVLYNANYNAGMANNRYGYDPSIIMLDAERIKSADPVTYDDNGDIIPLSERFNEGNEDIRYQQRDFRIDFNVPQLDTKALHEAVKGGEGTVENRFEVKYEKTDSGFAVHITDKDSGKTYDRAETVTEGNAKAEAERAAAAVIRNIKRGKPDSKSKSTAGIYIEKGEIPARDVNIPVSVKEGMRTSKLARTIAEASGMTEESVDELMDRVYDGFMSYKPDVNQESMDKALAKVEDDMAGAVTEWNEVVNKGKILSPDDVALGSALMVSASQSGNINEAMEIAAQLQDLATTGGKLVQSFRMIKRLGAAGAFYYINRQVAKINAELKKAAKGYKIEINQDLVNQLLAATDYHDIRDITEEIRKDLGHQLKPTLKDWLTAWRYTAMLGNLRTLDRNLLGNAGFIPIVMMKNVVNVGLQGAAKVLSGGKFQKTARLFASKQYTDFAKWDWNDQVKYDIKGNKYNDEANEIKQYMRYDTGAKGVLKIPAKVFNAWRSATTHAMEDKSVSVKFLGKDRKVYLLGDMAFKEAHYNYTLATRLQQQKVNTEMLKDVLARSRNGEVFKADSEEARLLDIYNKASEYAQQEANRNTYNDINAFARYISQMSKRAKESNNKVVRAAHYAIEGILPFKNTPANIISRAVEYSPIGIARTIAFDIGRLAKGRISGEQFIENLAKGITGSGLFALGAILAKSGILRGALGYDDDEDKDLKRKGHQSYSIEIFDKSITLDWLAPECIPLFMGVEFFNQMGDMSVDVWNEKGLKALLNVTTGAFEPMLNMSMLQGVNALFEGFKSKDDLAGLSKAFATIGTSYLTQFEPTLFGQFARTLDPYRRSTYIDKNSKLPPFISKFWQTAIKKIPGATDTLLPYVNEWGEKEKTPQWWVRALENFLSPAYINDLTETDVDREISRLFESTAETGAFPDSANKYVNYNGERYDLTQKEYEQYAVMRGETAYALAQEMIGTQWYNGLSDVEKVAAFADAYAYADTIASSAILDGRLGANAPDLETLAKNKNRSWVSKANVFAKTMGTPDALSQFIALRQTMAGMTGGRDARAEYLNGINELSSEAKALLMGMYDTSEGYAEGTAFYNKNGKLVIDFANPGEAAPAEQTATSPEDATAPAAVPAPTTAPAAQPTAEATAQPKSDKYTKAAEKWSPYGVTASQAKTAVEKWEQTGNASEYRAWLSKQSYTGRQKFAMYAQANADTEKKAVDFNKKYGTKFEALWDAYAKYDSNSFHGEDYRAWVEKQTNDYRQRFSLVEFAEPRSNWIEHAEELHKAGVSYKAVWEAARYAKNQSGQGKKDRIIAYAKKLGMTSKQAESIYKWFG